MNFRSILYLAVVQEDIVSARFTMSLFTAPASAAVKHRRELRERNTETEAVIMMQQHVELSNIFIIVTIVFSMKKYDKYFSSVSENLTKVIIIMLTPERDCVA